MTSEQLVARTPGLTYRVLDYWTRRGWLRPTAKGGAGNPRDWPDEEVRAAQTMTRLVQARVHPEAAHRAARNGGELAPGIRIVIEEPAHA